MRSNNVISFLNLQNYRYVVGIVVIRLGIPFLLFVQPYAAVTLSLIADALDGQLFFNAGLSWRVYNQVDKLLDYWWYLFILMYLWPTPLGNLAVVLLLFRTIGQLGGVIFQKESVYLYFPNVYEWVFCIYLVFPFMPVAGMVIGASVWALFVEWLIHKSNAHLLSRYLFHREIIWKKK